MRMLDTINSLMDISKIEAGQMDVYISDIDINNLMVELYDFFRPEAEGKGLSFILNNKSESYKLFIRSDREKIYSTLSNLLKNAIKYTKQGSIEFGYIIGGSEIVDSSELQNHNTILKAKKGEQIDLRFFVKDTGIGIPKDLLHSIFERFIQVNINDQNFYEGTGIGLSISKAFVEMLGGEIWVSSDEGKGSEFNFSHPYSAISPKIFDATIDQNIKKKYKPDNHRKLKVLIAEDNPMHAKLLSIMIADITKEILIAKSGREAINYCKENSDIDLLLLDIKMPILDGYEVAKEIRKFNKDLNYCTNSFCTDW